MTSRLQDSDTFFFLSFDRAHRLYAIHNIMHFSVLCSHPHGHMHAHIHVVARAADTRAHTTLQCLLSQFFFVLDFLKKKKKKNQAEPSSVLGGRTRDCVTVCYRDTDCVL